MEILSEKMIDNRLGEPLEKLLQNDPVYRERQKKLSETLREHWEIPPRTKKQRVWKSDKIWDSIGRYNYSYGKVAYQLGYEDGVRAGMEKKAAGKRSMFSLEDMTDMVRLYDAVKQLNITLFGHDEYHEKEEGVLGALDRVYYIIHNGIGCRLEFLGEDESDESITYILDKMDDSPEIKAKMLLGEIPVKAE
jgi:hypothetical protein